VGSAPVGRRRHTRPSTPDDTSDPARPVSGGCLRVGTSGFAYPAWAPAFYPAGTRGDALLPAYAARLPAVELSTTYYRQPTSAQAAAWAARTPPTFRFSVKLLRTGVLRAYGGDPADTLAWLTEPLGAFGARLGTALLRIPDDRPRDDARLAALLAAWPAATPLALELQNPAWHDDEIFAIAGAHGAVVVCTETDDAPNPPLTMTGPFVYLRLRRERYGTADLDAWAARLEPFLADGRDAFVFFRHDAHGATPGDAISLAARLPAYTAGGDPGGRAAT
jgi:uncharacterized protein YecE (DUF72 family)